MSLSAATRTALRLSRDGESRPCADEIKRRAVRAGEVTRRRMELACTDASDRSRELGLELRKIADRERRRDDVLWALEELIDDLGLVCTVAKTGERIHEPLQPVLGVHDLLRIRALEGVRLVV